MTVKNKQLLEQTDAALQNIIEGGEETLKAIYSNYRSEFLAWAKHQYNVPEDKAVDIFQDTVIVFYKNVVRGKITSLESSIKTYLYGIGKNMLLKLVTNNKKVVLVENMNGQLLDHIDWTVQHTSELNSRNETIREALGQLSEICFTIINLFYYKRFSMEAIKEHMGYKSEEVARTTKKKCMRKLEAFLKKELAK